jgi:hypothetical protein
MFHVMPCFIVPIMTALSLPFYSSTATFEERVQADGNVRKVHSSTYLLHCSCYLSGAYLLHPRLVFRGSNPPQTCPGVSRRLLYFSFQSPESRHRRSRCRFIAFFLLVLCPFLVPCFPFCSTPQPLPPSSVVPLNPFMFLI